LLRAILARAAENDVVRPDDVPVLARNPFDRGLEGRVVERLDLPAAVAHQVVVMIAARVRRLEPRDTVSEVDALEKTQLIQPLECSVHARNADPDTVAPEPVVDLLRGQAAVLAAEEPDDLAPRGAASPARLA
jgi:hypothetical protein